jgi:hypothetical protein
MVNMVGILAVLVSHFMPSTILGSSRFVVRYMVEEKVPPGLIAVAFMCALTSVTILLLGGGLIDRKSQGFESALVMVSRITAICFGVYISTVFYYFLSPVALLIPWDLIRDRLVLVNDFLSPTIRRVAQRTDTAWTAIEQYFR